MTYSIPSDAKWSYLVRRVDEPHAFSLGPVSTDPRLGDLVLAKVIAIGNHTHLEDVNGRRCRLYPGDLVVGAHGNRYASDYYEGYASSGRVLHLLAASGLMGTVASTHTSYGEPTTLQVLGSLQWPDGTTASVEQFAREMLPAEPPRAGTLVVVGSSMNAGKTTTTTSIIRGWGAAGLRPGGGKITGTGSGKDRWAYVDAGATRVTDFLDFGICSTYGYPVERLQRTMRAIRDALVNDGADAVVLEIADGVLQPETRGLLTALPGFADGVVLAVGDALAAKAGAELLQSAGLPLLAVSGLITASPLAMREAAAATGLPVLSPSALIGGAAVELLAHAPVA